MLEQVPVKAPGTPTMYPLDDLSSSARLTLLAAEFSNSPPASGIWSPALIIARGVEWKLRAVTAGLARAVRRRAVRKDIMKCAGLGVEVVENVSQAGRRGNCAFVLAGVVGSEVGQIT